MQCVCCPRPASPLVPGAPTYVLLLLLCALSRPLSLSTETSPLTCTRASVSPPIPLTAPIPSSRHLIPVHTSQQNCWKELSGVTVSTLSSFYPSPLHGGCSYRGHQWLLNPRSVLLSEVSVRILSAEHGRMSHLKRLKQYGHLLLRELSSH